MQDVYNSWKEALNDAFDELRTAQRRATGSEITRRWLAQQCAVHESTIKRILDGDHVPTDALKFRLAAVLGKRVDELFRWPNVIPPKTWLNDPVAS